MRPQNKQIKVLEEIVQLKIRARNAFTHVEKSPDIDLDKSHSWFDGRSIIEEFRAIGKSIENLEGKLNG